MAFEYAFKPEFQVTKEFLLEKNNQETYMSHYLGIPITKKLVCNPFRRDNHVTCAFYKSKKGTLYFKDFATGQSLDWVSVVMEKYGVSFKSALEMIAKDFGYINSDLKKPPPTIKPHPEFTEKSPTYIRVEVKDFTDGELKWWKSFGISKETLSKYKVFSCQTVFLNGNVCAVSTPQSPIYGYYFGKPGGVEQWKIYFPRRKTFRFLNNVSKNLIQGFSQLPEKGDVLVIQKSLKDCMCLAEFGIAACSPQSETTFLPLKVLEDLKSRFNCIAVTYDNDLAGISQMVKIHKQFPELSYLYIPRKYGAKDLTDFYRMYGIDRTRDLINEGLQYLKCRR